MVVNHVSGMNAVLNHPAGIGMNGGVVLARHDQYRLVYLVQLFGDQLAQLDQLYASFERIDWVPLPNRLTIDAFFWEGGHEAGGHTQKNAVLRGQGQSDGWGVKQQGGNFGLV